MRPILSHHRVLLRTMSAERTGEMLDLLAEMDLAAAQHVHAQLLASTEPKAVSELSRAYQRASRGLRQVLMLKMRHEADQAKRRPEPREPRQPSHREIMTGLRTRQLQGAVARVAAAAWPDRPRLQREALDRLDALIDEWDEDEETYDKLLIERLDDLVEEVAEFLGLPMALARTWEDLPDPPQTFDPAEAPSPLSDTG